MFGYIYMTTNQVNGKKYIGQHVSSVFEPDKYIGSGVLLLKAIKKHGKESFSCELLEECQSIEELDEKERKWIEHFDAVNDPQYYNISEGGVGGSKESLSKIQKEMWKDDGYRKRHSDSVKSVWADPAHREKHTEANRKADHKSLWTEERREEHRKVQKEAWKNEELLKEHSRICKELWNDPEKKKQQSDRMRGRKYHTDGKGNWIFVRPQDAPEGFYQTRWQWIWKDGKKKMHEKAKPIPEGYKTSR